MSELACPCCGQSWTPTRDKAGAVAAIKSLEVVGFRARILARLLKDFGNYVPRAQLIDAAYFDDPDGGPISASNTMASHVHHLRARVAPVGLVIDGKTGSGSRLRWARAAAPTAPAAASAADQRGGMSRVARPQLPSASVPSEISG